MKKPFLNTFEGIQEQGQIVGPVYPFSLAVEISIRYCKILHDPVVASGSLPDMFLEAIRKHNLELSRVS
jgi:hypothetical protein